MTRPQSIVRFEQLYLASIGVAVIDTAASWSALREQLAARAWTSAGLFAPAFVAMIFAVSLLLWYFAARRASVAAKWIVTGFAAITAINTLSDLAAVARGTTPLSAMLAVDVLETLLEVGAVTYLFRPDARAWFDETRSRLLPDELR